MTISFNCPTCGAENSAREESGGEYTACSRCAMRLLIPRPKAVPRAPDRDDGRVVHVQYSYGRIVTVIAVLIAVVTVLIRYPQSRKDDGEVAAEVAVEEFGAIDRAAPRPREAPARAAPVVKEAYVVKEVYSTTTKPVGGENAEIKRTMAQLAEVEAEKVKANEKRIADAKAAGEKQPEQKVAKKTKKKTVTKKRRTAADWQAALERAKALIDKQQWEAARKLLVEASTTATDNEAAEARRLIQKLPPDFRPKP